MDDQNRAHKTDAMNKIIGNMTPELQNRDGQYVPLGFASTATTTANDQQWNQSQTPCHYNNIGHVPIDQFNQPSAYNFLPQSQLLFDSAAFKNASLDYDMYKSMQQNGPSNMPDYHIHSIVNNEHLLQNQHEPSHLTPNSTHLIDNLVGNWMVPNNTGTYSPFGTSNDSFIPNVFEMQPERHSADFQLNDDPKFVSAEQLTVDDRQFQFTRDTRKPRMVAEVKPMRPSYSDVLTKAVPQSTVQSKSVKSDVKDAKPKKDGKKSTKNGDKMQKTITRSNTNNDIKEIGSNDKGIVNQMIKIEKNNNKTSKTGQLSRKWASLDNISEPMKATKAGDDAKKGKKFEENKNASTSSAAKSFNRKLNKTVSDIVDVESVPNKIETLNVSKNGLKKTSTSTVNKSNLKRQSDAFNERPPGKRNQRTRKKENPVLFGVFGQKLKQYTKGWWKIITVFVLWLYNLISDICSLSLHLARDSSVHFWSWLKIHYSSTVGISVDFLKSIRLFTWIWDKFKGNKADKETEESNSFVHNGLQNNINMPTTGDEAMKRLLACKGKDPYSILGVTPTCTDDDIKRYYKRQAFLVHPDKNQQPGAEEAFKILVHAFDMIGEPERRAAYDRGVVESAQVVQAWSELNELLQQLQQKVEAAANTIRCSACGSKHKRVKIDRPSYAARNCNTCKIHHSAREGDIWAEARVFGFLWHYYACMEGAVYDITEWAGCQKENLKHLRPDCHHVQYRIALGKQNNQPRRHNNTANNSNSRTDRPDLENLLNTLYGQNESSGAATTQTTRRKNKKSK